MSRPNPFLTQVNPITGTPMGAVTVADRIAMARKFTRRQCMQALALPDLAASVRAAVSRRLRTLHTEENEAFRATQRSGTR